MQKAFYNQAYLQAKNELLVVILCGIAAIVIKINIHGIIKSGKKEKKSCQRHIAFEDPSSKK